MFAGIHRTSTSSLARDLSGTFMGMAANQTFSGIHANSSGATAWLATEAYADIVSGSTMNTRDVLNPHAVIFVQLPLDTLLVTPMVGRAIMGALFNAVIHADVGQPVGTVAEEFFGSAVALLLVFTDDQTGKQLRQREIMPGEFITVIRKGECC